VSASKSCWTTNARWPTPWRVVFCEKMKNQVRNGGGTSVPPGLQLLKNGGYRLGVEWLKWLS
jgi:hypothetical protein